MSGVPTMDGASRLFCGSKVGKAQHAHENASTKCVRETLS
jgi:hypothetical protein